MSIGTGIFSAACVLSGAIVASYLIVAVLIGRNR